MSADPEVLRGLADKLERSLKQDTVGGLLKFMVEHGSGVLAALRASQSGGAAEMQEAAERICIDLYEGYERFNPEEKQAMIALSNAALFIRNLPLTQPDRLHETATGGETDA